LPSKEDKEMGENMKKPRTTIAASGLALLLCTVFGVAQSLAAAQALT
jgi:hypothetical protein